MTSARVNYSGVGAAPARPKTLDLLSPRMAVAVFAAVAFAIGAIFARKPVLGLEIVIALVYATIVTLDLPLALILYVPLTFLQTVNFHGVGPSAIGLVILVAWLGACRAGVVRFHDLFDHNKALAVLLGLLLLWNAATLVWAPDPGLGQSTLTDWARALLLFSLVLTTVRTTRDVRLLMAAFVLGAVLAVLAGVVTGGLHTAQNYEGRLTGAAGDPNYLAAGIVPAAVLAIALIATTRRWLVKSAMVSALFILAVGFAASESRGGLLGAGGAGICAIILFPRRRLAVFGAMCALALVIGLWFAADPAAFARITNFSSSGDGRSDLWTVALRVWHDHVIAGVGLNNFLAVEGNYVNRPGELTFLALIVDRPHVAHSVYLEALVDTGIVGLVLLLTVFFNVLRSSVQAVRRAAVRDLQELGVLARAVVAANIGVLISLIFLSDGPDSRLWVLFAMGPVILKLVSTTKRAPGVWPEAWADTSILGRRLTYSRGRS